MRHPPDAPQPQERLLSKQEIEAFECTTQFRELALKLKSANASSELDLIYEIFVLNSEIASYDDEFGYIFRYDIIDFVEDDGSFLPEDRRKGTIHKLESKLVIHKKGHEKYIIHIGSNFTLGTKLHGYSTPHSNLIDLLLEYRTLLEFFGHTLSDVNQIGSFGDSPIHVAAVRGHINELNILFENGADLNKQGEYGYTALLQAAEQGHVEATKWLLAHGANPELKTIDGTSVYDLATMIENKALKALFLQNHS